MASNEHDLGPLADFTDRAARRVELNGRALVVVRKGEEFFALRDICPHQGARLSNGRVGGQPLACLPGDEVDYAQMGEILTCPWHGWAFDVRTGCSLVDPEKKRVASYRVEVRGDRVVVQM